VETSGSSLGSFLREGHLFFIPQAFRLELGLTVEASRMRLYDGSGRKVRVDVG